MDIVHNKKSLSLFLYEQQSFIQSRWDFKKSFMIHRKYYAGFAPFLHEMNTQTVILVIQSGPSAISWHIHQQKCNQNVVILRFATGVFSNYQPLLGNYIFGSRTN